MKKSSFLPLGLAVELLSLADPIIMGTQMLDRGIVRVVRAATMQQPESSKLCCASMKPQEKATAITKIGVLKP